MKMKVLSVFDSAAQAFGRPAFVAAIGSAIRSFTDEVNRVDADNQMNQHPSDFTLYELGEFDDEHGRFTMLDTPRVLARAQDVKILRPEEC